MIKKIFSAVNIVTLLTVILLIFFGLSYSAAYKKKNLEDKQAIKDITDSINRLEKINKEIQIENVLRTVFMCMNLEQFNSIYDNECCPDNIPKNRIVHARLLDGNPIQVGWFDELGNYTRSFKRKGNKSETL